MSRVGGLDVRRKLTDPTHLTHPTYQTRLTHFLFRPDEHARSSVVPLIEDESRPATIEIVERQGHAIAVDIDIDALVVQERKMSRRNEAQQPEGDRDADNLARVLVVREDAKRFERSARPRGRRNLVAVNGWLFVLADFNERLLSGEPRTSARELLFRYLVARELGIDVPVHEQRCAADDGQSQNAQNDDGGDENRNPGLATAAGHRWCSLFGPDQQPIASLGDVQHEAWSMPLEIFERQALSLPAFFRDAQVREADPAASRNGPHEPAGKVDTRQSAFLTIIAKRMQGPERRPRPRRLAAQNGLTVRCQLDEWSLSLEPRPRLRELGKCGLALHRFGVHVRPHEHVCGAHERGHDQSGDD